MGRSSELVNAADKLAGVQQLLLPVVVIGEYGCGIAQSRNADQNRQWLDDMVKDCDVRHGSEYTSLVRRSASN